MVSDIDEGMMRRPHSVGHLHSPTEGGGHRPLSYYWVRLVVGLSHTSERPIPYKPIFPEDVENGQTLLFMAFKFENMLFPKTELSRIFMG